MTGFELAAGLQEIIDRQAEENRALLGLCSSLVAELSQYRAVEAEERRLEGMEREKA